MAKLIWVRGNHGPEPQYIRDDAAVLSGTGTLKKSQVIIEEIDIPAHEQGLDLGTLARLYPCGE